MCGSSLIPARIVVGVSGFQVLLDAPGEGARRVQIAQLGEYKDGRYGEFSITPENVENWKRNLNHLPGGRAPIDLDHLADKQPRKTEAAGWITGVDQDGDNVVADIEWTSLGESAIRDKRYLFFSPSYGEHKDEHGTVHDDTLVGGALTNKPFLSKLPVLTLASEENLQAAADIDDDERRLRLLDVLSGKQRDNLPKQAFAVPGQRAYPIHDLSHARNALSRASGKPEEAQVKAAVYKKYPQLKPSSGSSDSRRAMDTGQLIKILELDEDADDQKVLDALGELKEKAEKLEPEPTKTLEQQAGDAGKVLLDSQQFAELKLGAESGIKAAKELAEQRFETAFDKALREGRAVPEQREDKAHFYTLDAERTLKELAEGPVLVNVTPRGFTADPDDGAPEGVHPDSYKLDQLVQKRLKDLNRDPSEYIKTLEEIQNGQVSNGNGASS